MPEVGGPQDGSWPAYTPLAVAAGIGAVFAFPLQTGSSRFGVFTVFASEPRRLDHAETMRCQAIAELATEQLLDSSAASVDGEIDPDLKRAMGFRSEIYQGQGMVMVALRIPLVEAMALPWPGCVAMRS